MLKDAKTSYHRKEIENAEQKDLFRVIDKLSVPKDEIKLPSHKSPGELANRFSDYFHQKIQTLRQRLDTTPAAYFVDDLAVPCSTSFTSFSEVSEDDLLEVIRSSTVTSCNLDPLPSCIFKDCADTLLPALTQIVNKSITSGDFPSALKHANVIPLLKKAKLDSEVLANYRPISNLPYLGKLIERVVINQVQSYLTTNGLHTRAQSAYRPHHSTETALLSVINEVLCALDDHKEALLVLLDFSSAFDTIDHAILHRRLSSRYGITGKALEWFKSYLKDRTQSVVIGDSPSDRAILKWGVPQGSVAGPLLFTLYSAPLQDVITSHGVGTIVYADDTQLFLTFDPEDRDEALHRIEKCIEDVKRWAVENKLVLNDAKTELIHFTSRFSTSSLPPPRITIGDSEIVASLSARNLGVKVDHNLRMSDHISSVCQSALAALRRIGQIRPFLDSVTCARLVHALVTSRLDSCNSILFGLPLHEINRLQRVQNTAARLVARISRHEHITPVLKTLHWLPVHERTIYKLLLLTYKAVHGMSPVYIAENILLYKPSYNTRSSSKLLLDYTRKSSTKYYGDRAFATAAPTLWNNLPFTVRSSPTVAIFKTRLKTHLFSVKYLQV